MKKAFNSKDNMKHKFEQYFNSNFQVCDIKPHQVCDITIYWAFDVWRLCQFELFLLGKYPWRLADLLFFLEKYKTIIQF